MENEESQNVRQETGEDSSELHGWTQALCLWGGPFMRGRSELAEEFGKLIINMIEK